MNPMTEEERAAYLADMYPAGQPIPGESSDYDMAVSLPGNKLGKELIARSAATDPADTASTSNIPRGGPPQAAPIASSARRPLNPNTEQLPGLRALDPSVDLQNAPHPTRGGGGGFDFVRGLAGFGGGAAGIAAYDKAQQDAEDAPLRRANIADAMTDRQTKRQELLDAMNPNSASSKAAQADFAEAARARASMLAPKFPVLAASLEKAAGGVAGKSKLQILDMEKRHAAMFGEATKMLDSDSRQQLAAENMGLKRDSAKALQDNAAATRALSRDKLAEDTRHHKAEEEGKLAVKHEKDQEKLNEKVAGLNEQEELLKDAQEQKKKVNTGWLSNKLQQGLKYVGLADKDFMNLESTIAGVNNQIIKLQAGGNVTAGEATRMRQQLSDLSMDDEEFDIKLGRVLHQIEVKKKNAAKEYQRKAGGAVRDSAPIGKELVGKQGGTPAPHGDVVKQNGHTFQWDGSKYKQVD